MIEASLHPDTIVCGRESELRLCLANAGSGRVSRLRLKLQSPLGIAFVEGSRKVTMDMLDAGSERCHELVVKAERAGSFTFTITDFSCRNARGEYEEFPEQTLSLTVEEAAEPRISREEAAVEEPPAKEASTEEDLVGEGFDVVLGEVRPNLMAVLLSCEPFDSNGALRRLFVDGRLRPWRDLLPEAGSRRERVEATVAYLQDRRNSKGERALVLLLEVLTGRIHPEDGRYGQLEELARKLQGQLPDTR